MRLETHCHSLVKCVGDEFIKVLCLPFTEIQEEDSAESVNLVEEDGKHSHSLRKGKNPNLLILTRGERKLTRLS